MSERRRFRCNSCGERFETEVLTPEEQRRAQIERRPTSSIHCPRCNRTDIRDGYE